MARSYPLSTIVARCQKRSDKENDLQISASEWKALVSAQYGELYSIVEKSGMRYFESTQTIAATGAASYAMPTDHLASIGIDFIINSQGQRRELQELMVQERTQWSGMTGEAFAYAFVGQVIVLYPNPAAGSYEHLYMPQSPDLSAYADGTSVDVVTPDGEEFLVWGVTVKALSKSESDVQLAMAEREASRLRFEEWVTLRAFHSPRRRMVIDADPFDSYRAYGLRDPADWWNR